MRSKYNVIIRKEDGDQWYVEVRAGDEGIKGYPTIVMRTHVTGSVNKAIAAAVAAVSDWEEGR